MLSEQRQNGEKLIQFSIETERRQHRRDLEAKRAALIAQNRAEKEEQAKRVALKIERWNHAVILSDLCKRLSMVYSIPCQVNNVSLFNLLETYAWKCPASGQVHSIETPISLLFVKPLECGGAVTINNIKPKFYRGLMAGEWIIKRDNIIPFPPFQAPAPQEIQVQGAA
jgi:hypothetical protein